MDGTPARTSRVGFSIFLRRGGEYSLKKMALDKPKGNAMAAATTVTVSVPVIKGNTPYCALAKSGVHSLPVRNSQRDTS
ncbi:hypothetical protein SDC9_133431 [bioreactor metagenome]|uniref:Uncharacterized protein n=1 Tax=bioreactor metagenome TaxID=1076179 RepID=A0A645DCP2_9ZZZZ